MSAPLLQAKGIQMRLGGQQVLDRVDLDLNRGEIVTLIGPNGCGKTTLVRIVLGLMKPDAGEVTRRDGVRMGYVPQKLMVDPVLPLRVDRFVAMSGQVGRVDVQRTLEEVGVAHLARSPVQVISGGEMQRVLLARALVRQPQLLVLDEPVQGVDVSGQVELYDLIARIRKQRSCAVLMVSHDLHLVMASTDHVVCLNHHVCCSGHPSVVSKDPSFVALFGEAAAGLAVYTHEHDHHHDAAGEVVEHHHSG